ncbi:Type-5 uracil-DNA glycosylase [Nocardioides aquaticus]|uniref:Type-5 uracil-DNA glycosylase n=1 Tax=Nocardioides aquaticus TaxID=160826 RepID=A0ABX8ELH0_9ACTN|nr:uracil-DNA glycosylase [Nocardioides aquaticus]QVT81374.1 Type-5 uracil-DNA glycosylase [Nocardioides aquaticus]
MTDLPHPLTGRPYPSPVPPASGWPGDPTDARTADVPAGPWRELDATISTCRRCPRLVTWREEVAHAKRASYAGEPYWGRPVPGFGATDAGVLVVGLAPAAHGANRTGRVFTGDRSGDWLYAGLHRAGLATQPTSVHAGDGLELVGTRVAAAVRCAPPANKPTPAERDACAPFLDTELGLLAPHLRVVVALGSFGWAAALTALGRAGSAVPRPRPRFGHGAEAHLPALPGGPGPLVLLGCYHPSQQNTFTGRLTEPMLDAVLGRAAALG